MATATKIETVTVTLTLSHAEAGALRTILSFVSGNPDGERRHSEAITEALTNAGYGHRGHLYDSPFNFGSRLVYKDD